MKHILGIVGSPRKNGNTHVLLSAVLDAARAGGAETDLLFLADLRIDECDGCHACWKTGRCAKRDDMSPLYDRIAASDGLVCGTPFYWYVPTGLMKTFIDRFVYFNCVETRGKIRGKSAALVIPFEEENPETADLTVQFFEKSFEYLELKLTQTLRVPGVTQRGEVAARAADMAAAREMGARLAS